MKSSPESNKYMGPITLKFMANNQNRQKMGVTAWQRTFNKRYATVA